MSNLTDLVKVVVNIADVSLTLPGFGTPMVVSPLVEFEDRFRSYADLTGVGLDFDAESAVFKACQKLFGQEFSPDVVKVGRQQVDITGVAVSAVADSGDSVIATVAQNVDGDYVMSIRDGAGVFEVFTYAAVGKTKAEIATALVGLINGGTVDVTATDNGDGTITLTADVVDTPFQFALSGDTKNSFTIAGGYSVNISGTLNGTTSGSASTNITIAADIVLSIVQAIADQTLLITAANDGDGTYTVTSNPLGSPYSLNTDTQQTVELNFATGRTGISTLTPAVGETLTEALLAIENTSTEGADFYGVISTSIQTADVQALALGVEAMTRIYGTTTADPNVLDSAQTGDIGSVLQAQGLDRTWVLYTDKPEEFGDAAWFGRMLPINPGRDTWNVKPLAGVTVSDLSSTAKKAALAKNVNVYINFSGENRTNEGKMASGRFIDIQRSQDFMELDIAAAIGLRLLQSPKVPYTDAGGTILGGIVSARMQFFNDETILGPLLDSTSGELYRVAVPKVATQSALDRANRHFPGITAQGQIAGAIQTVEVTVNASV